MSGVGLLVPDILGDIMLRLPLSIDQKFTITQVSRFWRDVALHNHLFWSSFTGRDDYRGASKADCSRLPLVLERSGSSSTLHIQFCFTRDGADWPTDALKALVPYVARIETLDVEFNVAMDVKALLNSNLEFPALQTLRLNSYTYHTAPYILLTAPQLRNLDIKRVHLLNWVTLLSSSLENITIWDSTLEMFVGILKRCPRAWRIVLRSCDSWYGHSTQHDPFEAFSSRPLAPALRELELRVENSDLAQVLQAAFSDGVLPTLTGCICNGHCEDDLELLTGALLRSVGPLVFFKLVDMQDLELHDTDGRIRHLQCWNDDSSFEVEDTWIYLSIHYGLDKTVREIRIRLDYWEEFLAAFESYPPQLQDGITLAIDIDWNTFLPPVDDEEDGTQTIKIMRIPGLAKVEFCDSRNYARNPDFLLDTILEVLARIEPPAARNVEVCISEKKLKMKDPSSMQDPGAAFQTALLGKNWAICSHCMTV
ncbi:hypothetical protein B0H19DRAFT_1074818 [Mycena capillaripes]|nr:hypothetical protein B0H19DRAFT_1074818 [Mycena capillaripes]